MRYTYFKVPTALELVCCYKILDKLKEAMLSLNREAGFAIVSLS